MDLSLEGRHALVCGASSGIGRATALELARLGARVTALARSREKLEALTIDLKQAGSPEARFVVADLSIRPALKRHVEQLLSEAGPVHILLNNSGGPRSGPILEAEESEFLEAFNQHVLASHQLVRLCLPGMRDAGYGRIINVISTSVREPIAALGVSNTIRGAMASWAKTVSKELPPGVTINNILPGYTATDRLHVLSLAMAEKTGRSVSEVEEDWIRSIPERRIARPDELAGVIAFLASPAAAYIRGVSLPVDGGRLNSI